MQSAVNFFAVLNILGAAQALLLALALVGVKRGNRRANLLLAAFSATVSVLITWSVLNSAGYVSLFPHLLKINHPFDFVGGPLLYLYVRALTSSRPELKKKDLLHFIPFGLCVLYLLPYYFQSAEYKFNLNRGFNDVRWYYVRTSLAIIQFVGYLALAGLLTVRYLRENKERRTPFERATLFQVKFLVISFAALWFVAVLRYLFDIRYPAYTQYTDIVLPFGGTIIIYSMAYLGLRQPETPSGADEHASAAEVDALPAKKYEKSTLTPERAEAYLKKLLGLMERERPYTDGSLTLSKLAAKLSVTPHHLSQVINERLNQNFFDFVNTYRVEEAKRQLLADTKKHYSLLAIAEAVGFNSKSAFNAAFKKQTDMTPSDFKKDCDRPEHRQ
jgi:AraC-like DNA-binding protein